MNTKEMLHRVSDTYLTNKKAHVILDCLVESKSVDFEALMQLLVSTDEEVDMLPSASTIDLNKVEALIRENRKKWNGIDDIITIEIKYVNIFTHTIYYTFTFENESGKIVPRFGDFAYANSESIMP